jgi:hypothetical protein
MIAKGLFNISQMQAKVPSIFGNAISMCDPRGQICNAFGSKTCCTARRCESGITCIYVLRVVSRSEWPKSACAVLSDSPDSASCVACVCRNECHDTRGCLIRSHAGARERL